jgi:hypothetical protein
VSAPADGHDIAVPVVFWAFGGVLALLVVGVVVAIGVGALMALRDSTIDTPKIDPEEAESYKAEILAKRRSSARLQRFEPMLTWVSWTIGLAVALSLAITVMRYMRETTGRWAWLRERVYSFPWPEGIDPWQAAQGAVLATLVLGGAGIVGVAIAKAARPAAIRPLGLLWDVMAWLPRSAHPFGPACYAERAVPELADRMATWLEGGAQRRVILSTHSLGTVLGVAALFHLAAIGHGGRLSRIRLLSFGMQLRPYFGRFFPEFFGPAVLGTPGVAGPSLWKADPWRSKDLLPAEGSMDLLPSANGGASLTALLADRSSASADHAPFQPVWINLWRRTDYLGFPAHSYGQESNTLDQVVLEMEPDSYMATVATHGNYLSTVAYRSARTEILANWSLPEDPA